jgi:hypothetical protein
MKLYHATLSNLPPGAIVGVNVWGSRDDFPFFRYGYTSCLLDEGYFAFTDKALSYSGVAWFDEYDVPLGRATSAPPTTAWQNGVWRRDFERGVALVNPTSAPVKVSLEPGLKHFRGKQSPAVNDGSSATEITLAAKDGIILVREAPEAGRK